jgi:cytoskeletal protein RodZ
VTEPIAFGLRLRGLREARGISLEGVAQSTKIHIGQLAALESGDVSKWPAGIFARGFVRAYAEEVRTAAAPLVAEFCRVFPEVAGASASRPEHRLRITLVGASRLARATAWLTSGSRGPSRRYPPASRRALPTGTTGLRIV